MTKHDIDKELRRFGIKVTDKEYVAGATLLAALDVGTNADAIAHMLEQPRAVVRAIAKRLREQRVWVGQKTTCAWFEEHGGIAFMLDVNVALGFIGRTKEAA